jgi:hypothetical protein
MADDRSGRTQPTQQGPRKTDVPEAAPRLPHEHDESSDSQTSEEPRPVMRRAHDDLEAGRQDTDRGAPADAAYQKQKGGAAPRK